MHALRGQRPGPRIVPGGHLDKVAHDHHLARADTPQQPLAAIGGALAQVRPERRGALGAPLVRAPQHAPVLLEAQYVAAFHPVESAHRLQRPLYLLADLPGTGGHQPRRDRADQALRLHLMLEHFLLRKQVGVVALQHRHHPVEGVRHIGHLLGPAPVRPYSRLTALGGLHDGRQIVDRIGNAARDDAQHHQEQQRQGGGDNNVVQENAALYRVQIALGYGHVDVADELRARGVQLERRGPAAATAAGVYRRRETPVAAGLTDQRRMRRPQTACRRGPPRPLAHVEQRLAVEIVDRHAAYAGKGQGGRRGVARVVPAAIEQGQHTLARETLGDLPALLQERVLYLAAREPGSGERRGHRHAYDPQRERQRELPAKALLGGEQPCQHTHPPPLLAAHRKHQVEPLDLASREYQPQVVGGAQIDRDRQIAKQAQTRGAGPAPPRRP
ncbi:hypothetical protein BMS3Abin12_01354 [bacterium BMS3Abin12]|nr:hypothetical protein BMS3Abin12_01354 [bacterium BMS3Abin12]